MIFVDLNMSEFIIAILTATAIALFVFFSSPPKSNVKLEAPKPDPGLLAIVKNNLKSKNVVLYGASWCGYTVKQLNEIGGKDNVTYIDCAEEGNVQTCESQNIKAYPTWKINNETYSGYYSIETLSQMLK